MALVNYADPLFDVYAGYFLSDYKQTPFEIFSDCKKDVLEEDLDCGFSWGDDLFFPPVGGHRLHYATHTVIGGELCGHKDALNEFMVDKPVITQVRYPEYAYPNSKVTISATVRNSNPVEGITINYPNDPKGSESIDCNSEGGVKYSCEESITVSQYSGNELEFELQSGDTVNDNDQQYYQLGILEDGKEGKDASDNESKNPEDVINITEECVDLGDCNLNGYFIYDPEFGIDDYIDVYKFDVHDKDQINYWVESDDELYMSLLIPDGSSTNLLSVAESMNAFHCLESWVNGTVFLKIIKKPQPSIVIPKKLVAYTFGVTINNPINCDEESVRDISVMSTDEGIYFEETDDEDHIIGRYVSGKVRLGVSAKDDVGVNIQKINFSVLGSCDIGGGLDRFTIGDIPRLYSEIGKGIATASFDDGNCVIDVRDYGGQVYLNTHDIQDGELTIDVLVQGEGWEGNQLTLTVDNEPPDVWILEPDDDYLHGMITLEADVDEDGSGLEDVSWYLDNVKIGSGEETVWGAYGLEGDYELRVLARDKVGNEEEDSIWVELISPDLSVSDFSLSDDEPDVGEAVTLTAEICNEGSLDANDVNVTFYVDGEIIGSEIIDLPVEECDSLSAEWIATSGEHIIAIVADPENDIIESNESNNLEIVTVEVWGEEPELQIESPAPVDGSSAESPVEFIIPLKNIGKSVPSQCTITLNVWEGTNAGGISDKKHNTIDCRDPELKDGNTVEFTKSISLSPGTDYVYYLKVDYTGGSTGWYPSSSYGTEFKTTGEVPSISIEETSPVDEADFDGSSEIEFTIPLKNTGKSVPSECTITLNVWKGTNAGGIYDRDLNTIDCRDPGLKDGNTVEFTKSISLSPGTDYVYYLKVDYSDGSTGWYPSNMYGIEFKTTGEVPSISIEETTPADGADVDGEDSVNFTIKLKNTGTAPSQCTITLNVWKGTNAGGIYDMDQHLISCVDEALKDGNTVDFTESVSLAPGDYVYYVIVAYSGGNTGWYPSASHGVEFKVREPFSIDETDPKQGAKVNAASPVEFKIPLKNTGTAPGQCTITLNVWKGTNAGGIYDKEPNTIDCKNPELKDGNTVYFTKFISLDSGNYVYYLKVDHSDGSTGWYPSNKYGVEFKVREPFSIEETDPKQGARVNAASPVEFKIPLTNDRSTAPTKCTITLNVWKGTNAGRIYDRDQHLISCIDEALKDGNTGDFTESVSLALGDYVYYLKVDYTGGSTGWYPSASYGVEFTVAGDGPVVMLLAPPIEEESVAGSPVEFTFSLENTGTKAAEECTITLNVWKGTNGNICDKITRTIDCSGLNAGSSDEFTTSISLTGGSYVYYMKVDYTGGSTGWYPSDEYGVEFSVTGGGILPPETSTTSTTSTTSSTSTTTSTTSTSSSTSTTTSTSSTTSSAPITSTSTSTIT